MRLLSTIITLAGACTISGSVSAQTSPALSAAFDRNRPVLKLDVTQGIAPELWSSAHLSVVAKKKDGTETVIAVSRVATRKPETDASGNVVMRGATLRLDAGALQRDMRLKVRFSEAFRDASMTDAIETDWVALPDDSGDFSFRSLRGPSLDVDIRTSEASESDFALDIDYRLLSYEPLSSGDGRRAWGLRLDGMAHVQTEGAVSDIGLDSVVTALDVFVDQYFPSAGHRQASLLSGDVHVRNESTRDFDTSTWALGAGVAFDLGRLFPVQKVSTEPSALQRWNFLDNALHKRPIEAPRFGFGYDAVFSAGDSNRTARTGDTDDAFNRAFAEAAWSLPVLRAGSRLEISWLGYYDLDADHDAFEGFTQVQVNVPMSGSDPDGPLDFILKYIDGGLPPNYSSESSVQVGFSISAR